MGLGFATTDLFTTSKAEEKYNKYKSFVRRLDDEIETLDKEITKLADELLALQKIQNPINYSVGRYVDIYNQKSEEICSEISRNFIYYCDKQTDIKEKYTYVVYLRDKWEKIVTKENEQQREFTEDELREEY